MIADRIENFCLSIPHASFFHSPRYLKLIAKITGAADHSLIIERDGDIRGYFPVLGKDGRFGLVLNSSPFFGSNGGPLFKSAEDLPPLITQYDNLVEKASPVSATVIENLLQPFPEGSMRCDFVDERIGQVTDFAPGETVEMLMESFHYKTRNSIRKAQKSGVNIGIDHSKLGWLHRVHVQNIVALGGIAKPVIFFEQFPNYFRKGEDWDLFIASVGGEPVAGLLVFYYNKVVEYFTPVIVPEFRDQQPMSLLILEAMRLAVQKAFRAWNWGGTWKTQDGVYRFKSRWGTRDHLYRYFTRIRPHMLDLTQQEILNAYPHFFVCPFSKLRNPAFASQPQAKL